MRKRTCSVLAHLVPGQRLDLWFAILVGEVSALPFDCNWCVQSQHSTLRAASLSTQSERMVSFRTVWLRHILAGSFRHDVRIRSRKGARQRRSIRHSDLKSVLMKKFSVVASCLLLWGCGDTTVDTTTAPVPVEQPEIQADMASDATLKQGNEGMNWDHSIFGKTADDRPIEQYVLKNSAGTVVKLINYGATVTSVETIDRNGASGNIVLGHSSVKQWLQNPCYFGCVVGRYGNRIAGGVFSLGDNIHTLTKNDGENHLHGGDGGFHTRLWDAEAESTDTSVTVTFRYTSPDGEDGYPGALETTVAYTLNEDNELTIHYEASTDKETVVNLTNHCYWNLSGQADEKDVLDHIVTLRSDLYLPVDEGLIPTGELLPVADTPMDFTGEKTIGAELPEVDGGYDHCFVIKREVEGLVPAARVFAPESGRVLEISTTEPGIQFYSGNFLSGKDDNGGFGKHHGFCLETQHYPDSPNQKQFPSTTLKPGENYESTTVHKFSVDKG